MNDIARQLRAQIPSSTDPDRLERMAREIERGILRAGAPDRRSRGCMTPRICRSPRRGLTTASKPPCSASHGPADLDTLLRRVDP